MTTTTLKLLSKTVYPKWKDGGDEEPGLRPTDPDVLKMMVRMILRIGCQDDLDDANDDLEYDDATYTSFADTSPEDVFNEATFRMLGAPENWEYIHYVVGVDDTPRYHVIEVHESNPVGAVFAQGDLETVILTLDDCGFGAETPAFQSLEAPLKAIVWP